MARLRTIQILRGKKSGMPTLKQGELGMTTDEVGLYIGDGATNHQVAMKGSGGGLSENVSDSTVNFTASSSRTLPTTGEKLSGIIGKIVKWLSDLKAVAFSGSYNDLSNKPTSMKNPNALTISLNGISQEAYDGSEEKSINVTASSVGAAAASHTHNYAGSSSAGGNANAAVKLATARYIDGVNFDGSSGIIHFGTCSTTGSVKDKIVQIPNYTAVSGAKIAVQFQYANGVQNPTLNVSSTGAKPIYKYDQSPVGISDWPDNSIIEFLYTGTAYVMIEAGTAVQLSSSRTIQTNLGSTSTASFDGTSNITPGVTGTLPISNGGTGATSASAARSALGVAAASHNHSISDITSGILPESRGGTGNMNGTVSHLTTPRAIDGVDFDGTKAINHYGTCSTAAATIAKTVSLTGFSKVAGARIAVKFTYANTVAAPTLNVNSTGAASIYNYGGTSPGTGCWKAGEIVEFFYDGTAYYMVGAGTAVRLANARTIQTNLSSNEESSFDGLQDVMPGVTGTLPISNGGTGATSATQALANLGVFSEDPVYSKRVTVFGQTSADNYIDLRVYKIGFVCFVQISSTMQTDGSNGVTFQEFELPESCTPLTSAFGVAAEIAGNTAGGITRWEITGDRRVKFVASNPSTWYERNCCFSYIAANSDR